MRRIGFMFIVAILAISVGLCYKLTSRERVVRASEFSYLIEIRDNNIPYFFY